MVISDGKIVSVESNRNNGDIDAGGKRLIPGLIDVHTYGSNKTERFVWLVA